MSVFKCFTHSLFILAAATSLMICSCRKQDVNFGSQYLDNDNTQIVRIDTITPILTTVYIDSFVTAGSGTALIGTYADPYFGTIRASAYFEMNAPSTLMPSVQAVYDSIALVIRPNRSYYGDSTQPVNLTVYQLAENIELRNFATNFYNTSSFALGQQLGQGTYSVKPSFTDTLSIRLRDDLGRTLFSFLQNKDFNVQNSTNFINYFKGLFLTSSNGTMVFGLKDSIDMRVYYKEPGLNVERDDELIASFSLINSQHQFNSIQVDRSGTLLGNAGFGPAKKQVSSAQTNNLAFSQYLSSTLVKLNFANARALLQAPNFSRILSAQLLIEPLRGTFNNAAKDSLPKQLRLAQTNINNLFGPDLVSAAGGGAATQTGNLFIDGANVKATYSYDLGSYLQQQLAITDLSSIVNDGLLLLPPAPANSTLFNRVVVGDKKQKDSPIQLVVYYLAIQ